MFRKKLVIALSVVMLGSTVADFAAAANAAKKDCIPCTAYCQRHPNSPRCN